MTFNDFAKKSFETQKDEKLNNIQFSQFSMDSATSMYIGKFRNGSQSWVCGGAKNLLI